MKKISIFKKGKKVHSIKTGVLKSKTQPQKEWYLLEWNAKKCAENILCQIKDEWFVLVDTADQKEQMV